jgi:hypothetical protein
MEKREKQTIEERKSWEENLRRRKLISQASKDWKIIRERKKKSIIIKIISSRRRRRQKGEILKKSNQDEEEEEGLCWESFFL